MITSGRLMDDISDMIIETVDQTKRVKVDMKKRARSDRNDPIFVRDGMSNDLGNKNKMQLRAQKNIDAKILHS